MLVCVGVVCRGEGQIDTDVQREQGSILQRCQLKVLQKINVAQKGMTTQTYQRKSTQLFWPNWVLSVWHLRACQCSTCGTLELVSAVSVAP